MASSYANRIKKRGRFVDAKKREMERGHAASCRVHEVPALCCISVLGGEHRMPINVSSAYEAEEVRTWSTKFVESP